MENETEEPKKRFYTRWWFWVIIVIFVIIIISAAGGGQSGGTSTSDNSSVSQPQSQPSICDSSLQTLKKEAQKISYKQLTKDPNSFMGKTASFTGQILEIQQSGDTGILRLSVTNLGYGIWDPNDVIYVTYNKATQAVQDDIVTVTGTLTGTETYTSQANYQITIPSMNICSVETQTAKVVSPAVTSVTPTPQPTTVSTPTPTPKATPTVVPTTPTPTPAPQTGNQNTSPVSSETVSQQNAVEKAQSYLGISGFSHDGLVAQLEYDQFSPADAVYGADNSGADWNEQAAAKAKSYMGISAFSRGGLITQLEYDQFTPEQAEYGANAVGL